MLVVLFSDNSTIHSGHSETGMVAAIHSSIERSHFIIHHRYSAFLCSRTVGSSVEEIQVAEKLVCRTQTHAHRHTQTHTFTCLLHGDLDLAGSHKVS